MSGYTRISCLLWEWEPWNQLEAVTRLVWLALYTSPQAKRMVPALWHGSIPSIAESARMPVDETARALDTMIDRELAEYDAKHRVLRLTILPDAGEWPSNPDILKSWFKRFQMIPSCGVRDAHVQTIRWMIERGALEAEKNIGGRPSAKHEEVWSRTFGTVQIPIPRKRGIRRVADNNDTGTAVQPSLFAPVGERRSVDNPSSGASASDFPRSNDFNSPETLSTGSGEGEGEGVGVGEGEKISEGVGGKVIALVIPPRPPTVDGLLRAITEVCGGEWNLAPGSPERAALEEQVLDLPELDLALLSSWMRSKGLGDQLAIGRQLVTSPGALAWANDAAKGWNQERSDRTERAAEMSAELHRQMELAGLTTKGTA